MTTEIKIGHYTESIFYQIQLTARYIKIMGANHIDKIGLDLSSEELLALDIIYLNPGICQRDLAKELLKDRAGTGRVLLSLEAKQLVERFVTTKGKRLVRNMKLTQKGEDYLKLAHEKLIPSIEKLKKIFTEEEVSELKRMLDKLRHTLSLTVETQI